MSKYDEERKKIRDRMQVASVSFEPPSATASKYDEERAGMQAAGSKYDEERRSFTAPPTVATDEISNEIRMRPLKLLDSLKVANPQNPELDDAFHRLETKGDPLVERPPYLERVRTAVNNKWPAILQPIAFPFEAITEAPAVRAIGEALGTVKPEEEGYLPVSGAGKVAGQIIAPIGAALTTPGAQLGGGPLYQQAGNVLTRYAPNLANTARGRIAETAIKSVAEGVPTSVGGTLVMNPNASGKEVLESAAYGAGGSLLLGAGGKAIGEGLQKGIQSVLRPTLDAAQSLPDFMIRDYGRRLKPADRQVYINRIEPELSRRVSERMTPPLENPDELAKWLRPYMGGVDVSMNDIRKLGYEDMRQLAEEVRSGLSKSQIAVEEASAIGIDLPKLLKGEMPTIRGTGDKLPVWAPILNIKRPGLKPGTQPVAKVVADEAPFTPGLPEPPPEMGSNVSDLIAKELQIFDPTELKPISGLTARFRDFYRNMEHVMGDKAKPYLESLDQAKKGNIDMQEYWLNRLQTEVVDKLGIKKDSKLSALVQQFGEKKLTLQELKEKAPNDWEKVVEADKWFREAYDHLIDIVNETRVKLYPNSPDKWVPKRDDYYRHFRELDGLEGLKNLFESPAFIDPSLAGISEFTKPKSKFAGFMQKRGLGPYKNDAVGGFLNYIPAASYATHIDPEIGKIRSLSDAIAHSSPTGEPNNFTRYLNNFADDLSGKTQTIDRAIIDLMPGIDGRKVMGIVGWFNNRTKANIILGNAGSTLAQVFNIPLGLAHAKQYAAPGLKRAITSIFKKDEAMSQSPFLRERFIQDMYRQFDTDWLTVKNPLHLKKFAEWTMETADKIGTNFIWASVYEKALAKKVANPVAYADAETRKLIAGRGVGEQPLFLKSQVGKIVAPFQLEVGNLWHAIHDFVKKKDFAGLAILFVANWLFNKAAEEIRGSGGALDPIQAITDASEEGLSLAERFGRFGGEILSNLPLGQTAAATFFPQHAREKYFGDNDPTRFGAALPLAKGLQDPLHLLLPGFGGNQIRKTVQGVEAIQEDGSFTDSGQLKFPIDMTPTNIARMLAFGPNSTPEARAYYDNERRPLGARDTAGYLQSNNPDQYYNSILLRRDIDRIKQKINDIGKDEDLSQAQKQKQIDALVRQYQEALKQASAQ